MAALQFLNFYRPRYLSRPVRPSLLLLLTSFSSVWVGILVAYWAGLADPPPMLPHPSPSVSTAHPVTDKRELQLGALHSEELGKNLIQATESSYYESLALATHRAYYWHATVIRL